MTDRCVDTPLAYFITFRTYGTWLHGDPRHSVDRCNNVYDTPGIRTNTRLNRYETRSLKRSPFVMDALQRRATRRAIRLTCVLRKWRLHALNVRTNHVHSVVTAAARPELVLRAFKGYATKEMRETECWRSDESPWSRGGSKRYIWSESELDRAIDYVVNRQGVDLDPEYDDA